MEKREYLSEVIQELVSAQGMIDNENLYACADELIEAKRIFVCGAGRSGFIARAFSNRLMHLGKTVFFVGEPTTPSIGKEDLLVIVSGSGETGSLVAMARKAKGIGSRILLVTIHPDSTIGGFADCCLKMPGVTPKAVKEAEMTSIQPMGNLFEQLTWLSFDSIIMIMMEKMNMSAEEMFTRHANLE